MSTDSARDAERRLLAHDPAHDTGWYSTTSEATYLNPLKKTATGFRIQRKTTEDGTPLPVDHGVSIDWIAVHG